MATGEQLALEGMARSAENADQRVPNWTDRAYDMLVAYTKVQPRFPVEELRVWSYDEGLPLPPSDSAWGTVIKRASADGVVRFVGFTPSKNPAQHRKPIKLWAAA